MITLNRPHTDRVASFAPPPFPGPPRLLHSRSRRPFHITNIRSGIRTAHNGARAVPKDEFPRPEVRSFFRGGGRARCVRKTSAIRKRNGKKIASDPPSAPFKVRIRKRRKRHAAAHPQSAAAGRADTKPRAKRSPPRQPDLCREGSGRAALRRKEEAGGVSYTSSSGLRRQPPRRRKAPGVIPVTLLKRALK